MPTWMWVVLIIGGFSLLIFGFFWIVGSLIEEWVQTGILRKFEKELEAAIIHSQPTWKELKLIADTNSVSFSKIQPVLERVMRNALTGKIERLLNHKALIQSYIDESNEEEPFDNMPSEIRIHLERINDQLENGKTLLEPLTNQIRELLAINARERRVQRFYTIGGFFIGLLGFFFAIFTDYYAPPRELGEKYLMNGTEVLDPAANNYINQQGDRPAQN